MTGAEPPFAPAWLRYDDIRSLVEQFQDEYPESKKTPVPIEQIVEFDLSMEVVPVDGLQRDIGTDAFLSSSGDQVFVDKGAVDISLVRLRFSLAHEAGHYWMHDRFYRQANITSVASWKVARQRISEDYRWFEFQANAFAGLLLVPTDALRVAYDDAIGKATALGLSPDQIEEHPLRGRFIHGLADQFIVSPETMEIRLVKDGLLTELLRPDA